MQFKRSIVAYSVAAALAASSGSVAASGFALIEQSASGLGNAFAGGAAAAEDASSICFNPAGMSRLQGKQIAVALHGVKPSAKFSNAASVPALLQPTGGTGGDAGSLALIPNAYFTMEVSPKTRFGLGINAPFGLQTQYDANWMGRFQAIKSKLSTINLNPSFSYQLNDTISLGAGLNYQRIDGELSSATNYSALAAAAAATPGLPAPVAAALGAVAGGKAEGISTLTGSDSAWGYNLGALFNVSPQTRIGVAYRSSIKYNLKGAVSFTNVPVALAGSVRNQAVTLAITMPASFSLSGFLQLDDKWDVMADASWTGWGVFQQLNVLKTDGTSLSTTPENWKDTWRFSAGANYHYNERWTARAGLAFDKAPVSEAFRTARIPDANRTWLSVGGQYKASKASALDFGYAHLFVNNAAINQAAAGAGTLNGSYNNSVDILSVQYTLGF